ncbi:MAG TPA: hypothetical protein VM032_19310 [Vicinamibacterales bacterium]|nr:hypothetical protein [Vicinamibacterales bacterium]
MSARDVAWTTAAAAGLGCAVAAALGVWLLLRDPMTVSIAMSAHDLGALASAAAGAVRDLAGALFQ